MNIAFRAARLVSALWLAVPLFAFALPTRILAQSGSADPDFHPAVSAVSTFRCVVIQGDGKIVVGGNFPLDGVARESVLRLNADGSADPSFHPGVSVDGTVSAVVVQADGKIVLGGTFTTIDGNARVNLARLNADGSFDGSFDPSQSVKSQVLALALQDDGKVLVGCNSYDASGAPFDECLRLKTDGSLDTSFAIGSGPNGYVNCIVCQGDGKILLGGYFNAVNATPCAQAARLNSDGSLDSSFARQQLYGGEVIKMAVQADGKILCVSPPSYRYSQSPTYVLSRLNSDGSLDASFQRWRGGNGINSVSSVAVQSDGKIVISGAPQSFSRSVIYVDPHYGVARFYPDGTPNTSFNTGLLIGGNGYLNSLAVQPDGKIVGVGGYVSDSNVPYGVGLVRVLGGDNPPGTLQFSANGFTVNENGANATVTVSRTDSNGGPVSIQYATSDGTGVDSADYHAVSGTLSWADGDVEDKTITVPIIDRHLYEGTKTVLLTLSQPVGATLGAISQAVLTIADNDPPVITTDTLPVGRVGDVYQFQVAAVGNPTNFSASGLPAGLAIDPASGVITGVPTMVGTSAVLLQATSGSGTATASLDLTVLPAAPVITSPTQASGQPGIIFYYQIKADGSPTSFSASGLPPELSINTATGLISGVPSSPGVYSVTLGATNVGGLGTAPLSLTIQPPAPVLNSVLTATAQVGTNFGYLVTATNSPTAFGAEGLPPGLSIDPTSGLISGTPTQDGNYLVTLSATNGGGTAHAVLALTVNTPSANVQAVNILSPPADINIVLGETIDLEVAVDALPGKLARVEFEVEDLAGNSVFLGDSTAERDHKTWMPTALGDFLLSATVTDTAGVKTRARLPIHVVEGGNPPTSQFLSGLDGRTFAAGSSLPLVARTTAANGQSASTVKFFADGTILGEAPGTNALHSRGKTASSGNGSPFSRSVLSLAGAAGDRLLTVASTDAHGVTTVSGSVTIHVDAASPDAEALSCAITGPAEGGLVKKAAAVTVAAAKTGGSVRQVELFADDQRVGVSTVAPFVFTLPKLAGGHHALTAIATDERGVSKVSEPVLVTAKAPTVSILAAGSGEASESGGNGKVFVSRTGNSNEALTVYYTVAGTASAGTDYKELTGTVTIPAGASQAKIKVKAVDDAAREGNRTVKIKLSPTVDGSYSVSSTAKAATVRIIDND